MDDTGTIEHDPPESDHRVIRPLGDFLHTEAASGVVLLIATAVALIWANSPWKQSYFDLWHTRLTISLGDHVLDLDLQEWVNDGLMVIFFFVVGLEIKRELVEGELRDPRRAATPVIAALGGMVVPAGIFVLINLGGDGIHGWGIPMATDIAMTVGVLSLLGSRVAPSLKLFVLALAIVDDIGAILVIAIFYSDHLDVGALGLSFALIALVVVVRRLGVQNTWCYVAIGVAMWLAVHESGVHATLVGVVLGLMAPTKPARSADLIDADKLADVSTVESALETTKLARQSVSVVERLEHILHPWTSFLILPVFALANAGIPLTAGALSDAASSAVTWGIVIGLVVGKTVGVTLFTWLSIRLRIGTMPDGANWRSIVGVAALCGIGFTVAIFIAGLAFTDPGLTNEAKIGVLFASLFAALIGAAIIMVRKSARPPAPRR